MHLHDGCRGGRASCQLAPSLLWTVLGKKEPTSAGQQRERSGLIIQHVWRGARLRQQSRAERDPRRGSEANVYRGND